MPVNFSLIFSSWEQTPTGHVLEWHCRTIIHPIATRLAVPIPNSSAPNIAAMTTSFPVLNPPSVRKITLSLKLLRDKTWWTSLNPSSQGSPVYLILVCGLAPVPPLWPEIKIVSAFALATPAATVPMPDCATNLTQTLANGLICLRS